MIQVTRLNNQTVCINADLIKFLEQAPDTVITLLNGEKFIVRESVAEVVNRVIAFRRRVLQGVTSACDWVPGVSLSNARPEDDESEAER